MSLQTPRFEVDPPVVLAPMAGITNQAFRRLCREYGAGLYVSEMVTSRALIERSPETIRMVTPDPDEQIRSVQLYGVDPEVMSKAVEMGIDDEHLTYIEAGKIAAKAGVTWVALHARTAEQMYSGKARWQAIKTLVEELKEFNVPVLGNGDIWSAQDALEMVKETGCAGVVVGRGCLGRPWLFGQLAAAFAGKEIPKDPGLEVVSQIIKRHAVLLCELYGEYKGIRDIRKHMAWYLKGFSVGNQLRTSLAMVESLENLDFLLAKLDTNQAFPEVVVDKPRGRVGSQKKVSLPHNWLNSRSIEKNEVKDLREAELSVSGG